MVKDGCNRTASSVQIINITLAKLDFQPPTIIEKMCDQERPVFSGRFVKYNGGKCSFPATKMRSSSLFLSVKRCPHSKEIKERTVSVEDGCGRLAQFNQTIISHPKGKFALVHLRLFGFKKLHVLFIFTLNKT